MPGSVYAGSRRQPGKQSTSSWPPLSTGPGGVPVDASRSVPHHGTRLHRSRAL